MIGKTGLDCNHAALNVVGGMLEKRIRVYWRREKAWCWGRITTFNSESSCHTVAFDDGDEEEYDLLAPDKDRPAWEVEPFTGTNANCGERFGFRLCYGCCCLSLRGCIIGQLYIIVH